MPPTDFQSELDARGVVYLGGALGLVYMRNSVLSPLGLFSDDYVLVGLGIIAGGTAVGAALGWLASDATSTHGKPPKDTP